MIESFLTIVNRIKSVENSGSMPFAQMIPRWKMTAATSKFTRNFHNMILLINYTANSLRLQHLEAGGGWVQHSSG